MFRLVFDLAKFIDICPSIQGFSWVNKQPRVTTPSGGHGGHTPQTWFSFNNTSYLSSYREMSSYHLRDEGCKLFWTMFSQVFDRHDFIQLRPVSDVQGLQGISWHWYDYEYASLICVFNLSVRCTTFVNHTKPKVSVCWWYIAGFPTRGCEKLMII